jgi:hypothetical protein
LQGLYGRNHKGVIAIAKPDPALIAVLINREHSRLSSQVKTLERETKGHPLCCCCPTRVSPAADAHIISVI